MALTKFSTYHELLAENKNRIFSSVLVVTQGYNRAASAAPAFTNLKCRRLIMLVPGARCCGMYLMLLGGLVALWPTHNTTSHIRVRSFRPHQRPPRPGRSRAEHASASRPLQRPIRPSRARAPAELRSAASNIVRR